MNPDTTLPLDLAPLREGAEEMARAAWEAERAACYQTTPDHWVYRGDWGHGRGRGFRIEGCVRLLSDLTRPASRDWWVRWLARHHGLTVGATAPAWGCYVCGEHCADGDTGRMERCSRPIWSLMAADGQDPITFAECGIEAPDDREIIPSISALTDPAAALRLAILAAVGRTE